MQKIFLTAVALILFICQSAFAAPSPQWVKNLPAAKTSEQMVVIAGIVQTAAWISMHEKINGDWQQIMSTPGFIGKNGLGKIREGDGKTPVGTFKFDCAFGIAADPGCAIPYTQIDANHYWSGDKNFKYNQLVNLRGAPSTFDRTNSEHLIDYAPQYNYALNISYNSACTAGKGFGVFMQCFSDNKPWTGGGVALPEDKMLFVIQHVKQGCACVIDSLTNLGGSL